MIWVEIQSYWHSVFFDAKKNVHCAWFVVVCVSIMFTRVRWWTCENVVFLSQFLFLHSLLKLVLHNMSWFVLEQLPITNIESTHLFLMSCIKITTSFYVSPQLVWIQVFICSHTLNSLVWHLQLFQTPTFGVCIPRELRHSFPHLRLPLIFRVRCNLELIMVMES